MLECARTGSRRLVPKRMYWTTVPNYSSVSTTGGLGEDSDNPNHKQQQQVPSTDSTPKAWHTWSHSVLPIIV